MNRLRLLLRQTRYENRAFWRNPESAFFTFAFPLVFMLILNLVFATGGGQDVLVFYTPAIIAFSIVNARPLMAALLLGLAQLEAEHRLRT